MSELSDNPCRDCLLQCDPVDTSGSKSARFLVVGKPVTKNQKRETTHNLTKGALRLFSKHMELNGFSREDFIFTNSVKCAYDQEEYISSDRKHIKATCKRHLDKLIREVGPEVVIPLGADAANAVFGKSVKITKVRGLLSTSETGQKILPLLDPSFVYVYPQHEAIFASDCKSLKRMVDFDYNVEEAESSAYGEYEFIDDLQFLIDENPEYLAFDTETMGLRWASRNSKILTMQFCPEPGRAYMLVWDHPEKPIPARRKAKLRAQLRELLQNPDISVVTQGGKYDCLWMIEKLDIRFRIDHDTNMLAAQIDENLQSKDLDTLTKIYAPKMAGYADSFNSRYDKEHMENVPLKDLLIYGCGDTDATMRVFYALSNKLYQDEKAWNNYRRVSIPGINAFVMVERRGIPVNPDRIEAIDEALTEELKNRYRSLIAQVPRSIKRAHVEKGLKFSRSDFIKDILFNHADGFRLKPKVFTKGTAKLKNEKLREPSVSTKDHLPYFFDSCPFTYELSEYIKLERLLGTNVRGFRDKYLQNGKVHSTYSLSKTVTGRSSTSDPNGQNYPERGEVAKVYKTMFPALPGYCILRGDLSQAELRIAAHMARERTLIRIYQQNGDVHSYTAADSMGLTMEQFMRLSKEERKAGRTNAKAVNFGYIYGMWWRKFMVYAKTQYGIDYSESEAKSSREGFFRRYPGIEKWHTAMREFAMQHGYVRSLSGRVRHLPAVYSNEEFIQQEALRQAVNSPVQCFASELGVMSMSRIDQEVDDTYLAVNNFVHDALYAIVPLENLEWGAKTLKYYMESNPLEEWFDLTLSVPIVADISFATVDAGHMYEMGEIDLDKPYDFNALAESNDVKGGFRLPRQKIPPNNGRIVQPEYLRIEV